MPRGETTIPLLTHDPETEVAVRAALDGEPRTDGLVLLPELPEMVDRLQGSMTPVALVDLDYLPQRDHALNELDPVIARFPETRFVLLSGQVDQGLLQQAMQVGARQLLAKEEIPSRLLPTMQRLLVGSRSGTERRGQLSLVLSAGGGCGATTFAVNLANELHLATHQPTLLLDLDLSYGAAASYLGLESRYGLPDVLAHPAHPDPELVRSSAVEVRPGFSVLLSPASLRPARLEPIFLDQIEPVLMACRMGYEHIVVDAPRLPLRTTLALARDANHLFLLLQLMLKDLQVTRQLVNELVAQGVPAPTLLANRYRRRTPTIAFQEAQRALGRVSLEALPNDFRCAVECLTYGQPLSDRAPRSALRKEIRQYALTLAPQVSEAGRTSRFSWKR